MLAPAFPNVIGYSKALMPRIRRGRKVDEECLQMHVARKVDLRALAAVEILPLTVEDIGIDVVNVGPLRIPVPPIEANVLAKTDRISPLVGGISIGNKAITAGTLGDFVEKTRAPDKNTNMAATNAHVGSKDPLKEGSEEKVITQPGPYDGGVDAALEYYWHKRLYPIDTPSDCPVMGGAASLLNFFARVGHAKTRLIPVLQEQNHIDICTALIKEKWENRFFDVEYHSSKFDAAGYGFAGSDQSGLTCKGYPYFAVDEGYDVIGFDWAEEFFVGDVLHKTGRTSCYNKCNIRNPSVYELVGYGAYIVPIDDAILHDPNLQGGDSGSGMFKEIM